MSTDSPAFSSLPKRLQPGAVWRDPIPLLPEDAVPEMATLPPGSFLMGAGADDPDAEEDEKPQHAVQLDYCFAMGRNPVTFEQWDAAIAAGAKLHKPDHKGWGGGKLPVTLVSIADSERYCAWLNKQLALDGRTDAYRMPSEAEWEYACRACATTRYNTGDEITATQANFAADRVKAWKEFGHAPQMTPVDAFPANAFGLHDMHGNVWERCADRWHESYDEPGRPDDGRPWLEGDSPLYVTRGGSWLSKPSDVRCSHRSTAMPDYRSTIIGFRIARTITSLIN